MAKIIKILKNLFMDCWGNKLLYKTSKGILKMELSFYFWLTLTFFIDKKVYNLVKNEKSEYCLG